MKSKLISILLVFLFGFLGIHRFYLNKSKVGFILLGLFVSFFTLVLMSMNIVALILLLVLSGWWLFEIFLVLSGKLKAELVSELLSKPKDTEIKTSPLSLENEPKSSSQLNGFEEDLITMETVSQKKQKKADFKLEV